VLTLNLPTTTIVAQPFNIIKWQLKFSPVAPNSTLIPNLRLSIKTMATPCAKALRSPPAIPHSAEMTRSALFLVLAVPHDVLLCDNHFACLKGRVPTPLSPIFSKK